MRLFVIGNGFDINLGLNTSYKDFYYFLKQKHPEFLIETGEILWAKKETDPLWSNFERELCSVNFMPFSIEDYECSENVSFYGLYEMKLNGIFSWKESLDKYFREWIDFSYTTPKHKPYVFDENDYFVNFNYTNSLENVYSVKRDHILYIHGRANDIGPLIFGHGVTHDLTKLYDDLNLTTDGYIICSASQLNDLIAIDTLIDQLRKPVDKLKMQLENWLNNLSEIRDVYVLGHSLGEVDLPYFQVIKEAATLDAKWHFSYHSDKDKDNITKRTDELSINAFSVAKIDEILKKCKNQGNMKLSKQEVIAVAFVMHYLIILKY